MKCSIDIMLQVLIISLFKKNRTDRVWFFNKKLSKIYFKLKELSFGPPCTFLWFAK